MTTLTVTTNGKSYSYDASVQQIAGLQAKTNEINAKVPEGGDPTFETPQHLLEDSIISWLTSNPAATDEQVVATMERALNNWADVPSEVLVPDEGPLTKEQLLAYAADKRWQKEVGGTVWNGHGVATDRPSQSKSLAEFVAISANLRTDPSLWKFKDGFAELSSADMSQVVLAGRAHVAACFAVEGSLEVSINDGTVTTKAEIDVAAWPSST